jgi:hypothetical protein
MDATDWAHKAEMNVVRDAETAAFVKKYMAAQASRTDEEIAEHNYELRAAFGPGEEVVNIITGKRTRT